MPVTIRRTTVADLRERCAHLIAAHWAEVVGHGEPRPLWARAQIAESLGTEDGEPRILVFVAEVGGAPVGYAVAWVDEDMQQAGRVQCTAMAIFAAAEHRGTGAGIGLFRAVEAEAKAVADRHGMRLQMVWHGQSGGRLIAMAERLGYRETAVVMAKES